jgi:hypothetical protein
MTLFVYARAVDAPGPPLAVLRQPVATWPAKNGANRAITSRAEPIRRPGSLAIMSAMTSTNSGLRCGLSRRGSNGRRSQCARALSAVVPPGNGTFPVTA